MSAVVAGITVAGCASHGLASSAAGSSGGLTNAQRALAVRISQIEGWGSRPSDPGEYPPGVDSSAPGSWPTDVENASVILTTHEDAMQYVGGGTEAGDGSRLVLVIRLVGDFSWITTGPPGHGPVTGNVATIVVDASSGQATDTGLESNNSPASLPGATLLYKTGDTPQVSPTQSGLGSSTSLPAVAPTPTLAPSLPTGTSACGEYGITATTPAGTEPLLTCAGMADGTSMVRVHVGDQILLSGLVDQTFVTSSPAAVLDVHGSLLTARLPGAATVIVHNWFCLPVNAAQSTSCPLLQVTVAPGP
jgi:hypothetical protein